MDLPWWIQFIAIPVVVGLLWADFYIHRNATAECDKIVAAKDSEIAALHARINASNKDFYEYRINASSLYATTVAVGEMRRELVAVVTRIEDKLDRIGERNDRRDSRNL